MWQSALVFLAVMRLSAAALVYANPDRFLFPDSEAYLDLAANLVEDGQYTSRERPMEDARRPPLYPLFLAGTNIAFDGKLGAIAFIQLTLQAITGGLLYLSGRHLGGRIAGMVAAGFFFLSPNGLFWALPVMSETMFALLLALATYLFIRASLIASLTTFVLCGLSLAASALTRPAGAILIPIFAVFIVFNRAQSSSTIHERIRCAAAFLLVASIPLIAWAVRNRVVHGQFTLSTTFGITLTQYVVADTLADAQGITREQARDQIPSFSEDLSFNLDIIRQYPASFLKLSSKGVLRTALGTEVGTWMVVAFGQPYEGSGMLEALSSLDFSEFRDSFRSLAESSTQLRPALLLFWGIAYSAALFIVSARGAFKASRAGYTWIVALLVLSIVALIVLPLSAGEARFRVSAEPFLALLFGFAFLRMDRDNRRIHALPND
jgi:4-amino-4-deoxy-L-arabinose transferase-like glycosyltransferase